MNAYYIIKFFTVTRPLLKRNRRRLLGIRKTILIKDYTVVVCGRIPAAEAATRWCVCIFTVVLKLLSFEYASNFYFLSSSPYEPKSVTIILIFFCFVLCTNESEEKLKTSISCIYNMTCIRTVLRILTRRNYYCVRVLTGVYKRVIFFLCGENITDTYIVRKTLVFYTAITPMARIGLLNMKN